MTDRFFIAMCAAGALVSQAPMPVVAQTDTDHRTVPRTSWGAPDLQGVWNNNVSTPMERPDEFADRALLSAEERAANTAQRQASRENRDSRQGRGTDADVRRAVLGAARPEFAPYGAQRPLVPRAGNRAQPHVTHSGSPDWKDSSLDTGGTATSGRQASAEAEPSCRPRGSELVGALYHARSAEDAR